MDSNASGFLLNNSILQSVYCRSNEENGIIDLGLSLRTLQPQPYHHSSTHKLRPKDYDDEAEGVQSKERWAYVKVNMDGVMVGRKVCMLDHGGYLGLAHQLEKMFGRHSSSGLRLFEFGSEYLLFYKDDMEENWRNAGDVPWKEFVERVKRMRICQKNEALYRPCSSSSSFK